MLIKRSVNIVWFKKDLRVYDHEALMEASRTNDILPIYIIEKEMWDQRSHSRRQWLFLKECLIDLQTQLKNIGQPLIIRYGDVIEIFEEIKKDYSIQAIYSHQETGDYYSFKRDLKVKDWVLQNSINWKEYLQFAVFRGDQDRNKWSRKRDNLMLKNTIKRPIKTNVLAINPGSFPNNNFFEFQDDKCEGRLKGGRKKGISRLNYFIENELINYSKNISSPQESLESCSRLSPYISMGCISIREILHKIKHIKGNNVKMLRSRLAWHCHFVQKLESQPELEFKELHPFFMGIRVKNESLLRIWSEGKTGFPFLDACMRSLNFNGWLNFRMRAMLISFASYNLWQPWQDSGLILAQKFIDYEPGIHWNQCQMQSGTTSINTNRIYNPIKQGKDHDPNGHFIRKWIPELEIVPDAYIHEPWIIINQNKTKFKELVNTYYAKPIVDINLTTKEARSKLFKISQKKDYYEISKSIYLKHGSRKSNFKKKPISKQKRKKFQNYNHQFELNIKL